MWWFQIPDFKFDLKVNASKINKKVFKYTYKMQKKISNEFHIQIVYRRYKDKCFNNCKLILKCIS